MTVLTYTTIRKPRLSSIYLQNSKVLKSRIRLNLNALSFIFGIILISLIILYLNEAAYYIGLSSLSLRLTNQNQNLSKLNTQLKIQAAQVENLDYLEKKAQELGFSQIKQIYPEQVLVSQNY